MFSGKIGRRPVNEVYEKAIQAIAHVEKSEVEEATESDITFTMPISVAIQVFATVHVAIKSTEEDISLDLKRRSLPSQYTRSTLSQLRKAVTIIHNAISGTS
jgi:autotransporter translocation and assembly factor TamB